MDKLWIMNIEEEKKKLQQKLSDLQQKKAVYDSRIQELSQELGVEPDLQKIGEAIKSAEEEERRIEGRVQELVEQYQKLTV